MGKKGDLLRALKAAQKSYTFTHEQLKEHDRVVALEALKRAEKEIEKKAQAAYEAKNKEIDEYITKEWEARKKLFMDEHPNDSLINILSLLMATSCRVLIEKFHWRPIPKDGQYDHRNRTVRFSDYLTDEVMAITQDDNLDIRRYCDETYEKYGIRFDVIES